MAGVNLLDAVASAPYVGEVHPVNLRHLYSKKTFHFVLSGTGSVSANVLIEVSNDGTNFIHDGNSNITLSGTTLVSDGIVLVAAWQYVRASVLSISGTLATVSVRMAS